MKRLLKYMTLYDKIVIVSIISLSLLFIAYPFINMPADEDTNNNFIIIQSGNGIEERIPVARTYEEGPLTFTVKGPIGTSIIEADDGRVRLHEAPPDDPLKICEKTGWISRSGPAIVCVPNQISIWIESGETDLDGVSW